MALTYLRTVSDKEVREQRVRIEKLIKKWLIPLGLGQWQVDIDYYGDIGSEDDYETIYMTCKANWPYLDAKLAVNLGACATLDDDKLERAFLHELMHIFLNEMRQKEKEDHEERVATQLANAFVWVSKQIK